MSRSQRPRFVQFRENKTYRGSPLSLFNHARYDQVNRIASVSDPGYSRTFNYDAYGNVWVYPHTGPLDGTTPTSNAYSNNRIGSNYDGAGNQTVVNGNSITYDAENRQVTVVDGVYKTSTSYAYDGDGKRVQKTNPNGTTIFVYDAAGLLAAEYSTAATGTSPCLTCYLSTDHLGSTRLVTNENGGVVSRHDFAPFGDEVTAARGAQWGPAADTINQKFTGKERDSETGMDFFGARYYGSALGRFTSPDPLLNSARPRDPQTWNRYAYARNNPLARIDPTGLYDLGACQGSKQQCAKWRDEFNNGIKAAQSALASGKLSDKDAKNLSRVLKYLGGANDKNGITVAFGNISGAAEGILAGPNSIKLDMQKIDSRFSQSGMSDFNKTAELGGEGVHEATHGRDQATGVFSFTMQTDTATHRLQGYLGEYFAEERAYRNQSLVFQGLGLESPTGLWNPSWAAPDAETLRSAGVRAGALASAGEVLDSVQKESR